MRARFAWVMAALCAACAPRSSYVKVNDVPLGRVVVYRNGIAYYERRAHVEKGALEVSVPRALVDDFLKSLTVADARSHQPLPVRFPRERSGDGETIHMTLQVPSARADVLMTYVTSAPAWKPSYRLVLGRDGKVFLEGWAIIDNTSGEDWKDVEIGVGASSAMSFRYDLWSVRAVEREELRDDQRFASAPPTALAPVPAAPPAVVDALVGDGDGVAFSGSTSFENQYVVDGVNTTGEVVTVTGHVPSIDPTSTSSGVTIDKEYTRTIPQGRTFDAVLGTAAGSQADGGGPPPPPPPDPRQVERERITQLARAALASGRAIAITTYAPGPAPAPRVVEQARRARDTLIDAGVPVARIAQRAEAGPRDTLRIDLVAPPDRAAAPAAGDDQPIGEERFTAPGLMTVPRATSAMVPIVRAETHGEVVYLYDPVSARGNQRYAFRAVHVRNPTAQTLEGGPISVYGDDHFIGEGMVDQIVPGGTAVVPFALDRQVVVERAISDGRELRRIISAERGVIRAEMQDQRTTAFTLQSRLATPTTVYVVYRQDPDWEVVAQPVEPERIAGALVYAVPLAPGERRTVAIRETQPLERALALTAPETADLLATYVAAPDADPELRARLDGVLALHRALADHAQTIASLRERLDEYRARQDELGAEIVALGKARTGAELARHLQAKLLQISGRVQATTIAIVDEQERALLTRVQYADAIADLRLTDVRAAGARPTAASGATTAAPGATRPATASSSAAHD